MKFSIRFADQIVGTLVILALAILVFVIFMLGKSQRWFAKDKQYITYLNSASGVSPNMAIQYKGFKIGHVNKITLSKNDENEILLTNNNVVVEFTIFEEYSEIVKEGSLVELSSSPIPGLGTSLVFYPGRGTESIKGDVIPEANSDDGKKIIRAGNVDRPEASDGISSIINQINTLLGSLNVSSENSEITDEHALAQTLLNVKTITEEVSALTQTLNGQLTPILSDVKVVTDQISDPSGTLMSVLGSEGSLSSSLESALESLAGIIDNLEKTSVFIPAQLPQIGVMISDLNGALRTVQDVLTAVANNPLLKGGIPEHKETGPGAASPRDMEF